MTLGIGVARTMYPAIIPALERLYDLCGEGEAAWMLGGSCGLFLQDVTLPSPPRDIDIYSDMENADKVHQRLADIAIDNPRLDRSGQYESLLSHYQIHDMKIELVGGFVVKAIDTVYRTEIDELLLEESAKFQLGPERVIHLMPLAHEFVFNVLRNRPDRYIPISESIRREPKEHIPLLIRILKRNSWHADMVAEMEQLLGNPHLASEL